MSDGNRGPVYSPKFHDAEYNEDQDGHDYEKLEECRAAASSRSQ
jgi:hypothetical protein